MFQSDAQTNSKQWIHGLPILLCDGSAGYVYIWSIYSLNDTVYS